MKIAFFGSSLLSAYWNGAATYYRGLLRALAARGHTITFYEPDAYDRQAHRDIEPPEWAKVIVYANELGAAEAQIDHAKHADLIVKASGVGVFDEYLESAVLSLKTSTNQVIFWDVDAPATLARVANSEDPFHTCIPLYDLIMTYGGGPAVVSGYQALGAKGCVAIYNAVDSRTHYHTKPNSRFQADVSLLANRLPDREARVTDLFFEVAAALPEKQFVLGGNGWADRERPQNVNYVGHVYTADHNAFNCSSGLVLNINRDSMASFGFSPPTRIFEAAAAGACLLTDYWPGVEEFFEPGKEILVGRGRAEFIEIIRDLTSERANQIGQSAYKRALSQHTYESRAEEVEKALGWLKGEL